MVYGTRKVSAPEKSFCEKKRNFKALKIMKIKPHYVTQSIHLTQERKTKRP